MDRMTLAAGALLVALTGDAFAQAEKIDEPLDPGRMGVAREQSGPAGDLLSQRAPPGSADARTDQPRQSTLGDDSLAATSALTKIEKARPDPGRPPASGD